MSQDNLIELKYKCGYCKYEFKQEVRTTKGGKHSKGSTMVICPRCGNGLKTWEGK